MYSSYYFCRQLVQLGVLYDYKGDCWLTIPNINQFTKTFNRGRKAVLTMIKKCKYNAILEKVRKICNKTFSNGLATES